MHGPLPPTYAAPSPPVTVTRIRRLSRDCLITESTSRSPRLDRIVAHGSIFDKASRYMIEDLDVSGNVVSKRTSVLSSRPKCSRGQAKERVPIVEVSTVCVEEVEDIDD